MRAILASVADVFLILLGSIFLFLQCLAIIWILWLIYILSGVVL